MTEQAIVVRNSGTAPSAPPPAITGLGGALPEVLQLCNAIAQAGDMIPSAYRGKPGAVLLAKMWADRHDVDLFTAVQQIFPIDGKPYVSAAMRVALATAKGFDLRVTDSTREVCTIEVWRDGELRGAVTSRYDDAPRKEKTAKGAPTPWALHPDDMLFADACRKADRRYVQTAAALLDAGQDYTDDELDPLDVIADTPEPEPEPIAEHDAITGDDLRERIKNATGVTIPKVLRAVQKHLPDGGFSDLETVAADGQALDYALGYIERGGE